MLDTFFLFVGLALILLGANGLTDGAAAVAKRFQISDLVIGLTIVALGTSAPELVISVMAALGGSAEMAIGNVVGSNIFNVLAIIGVTALVTPIKVGEGTLNKEIPLMILCSIVLAIMANDIVLDGDMSNIISRIDGLVLLGFFLIFLRYTFAIARNGSSEEAEGEKIQEMPIWKSVLFIAGGLEGLIYGGQLFVDGASGIAASLGVSESIIGLTIGNVVGSNLFNVFFVLGCSASISPLPMGGINNVDMLVLVVSTILFWIVGCFFKKRTITRLEGALLVICYVMYTAFLISQQ